MWKIGLFFSFPLTFGGFDAILLFVKDDDRKEVTVSEPKESCRVVRGAGRGYGEYIPRVSC